jgi:hypothetical protein
MRFQSVLIRLEPETYRQLVNVARIEDRGIDQQATHLVRRELRRLARSQPASAETREVRADAVTK